MNPRGSIEKCTLDSYKNILLDEQGKSWRKTKDARKILKQFLSLLGQCMDPENHVTSNRSSGSVENLKPVFQETNATAKTDVCTEMYHVPFVMRKPKGYVQHLFRERISYAENVCNILPQNFTDNPNRIITVESQHYPTTNQNNVQSMKRAAILANRNSSDSNDKQPGPLAPKENAKCKPQ